MLCSELYIVSCGHFLCILYQSLTCGLNGTILFNMTIGRPLKFDPDVALESAMQLFWRKGYESSSLQELLYTMELSRSSFYQTFKSKHSLFQRCIQFYRQMLTDTMYTQLDKNGSGKSFIKTLFHSVADETSGPDAQLGCMVMNVASEFAQTDHQIAQIVSSSIESFIDVFETAIKQAQTQGEISTDKDARSLAHYFVSSMSGLKNMVKGGADRETIKRIANIILSALD